MEEKWIKVNEIEYTHKELSQIYKNLEEKDISDHTENLEDLVKDNFLIQELKIIQYHMHADGLKS